MARAWAAGLVILGMLGCERGPGLFEGSIESKPFDLRQTKLSRGADGLLIEAQDQLTDCAERVKDGRVIRLMWRDQALPAPGIYSLTDGGVGGFDVERHVSNDTCSVIRVMRARAAQIEVVEVKEDEADFRLSVSFPDGELQGSLHAVSCRANTPRFCEANQP